MNYKDTEHLMRTLGDMNKAVLESNIGRPIGFALIVFEFNDPGIGNYISNAERDDMIIALRETANRLEKNEYIPTPQGEA